MINNNSFWKYNENNRVELYFERCCVAIERKILDEEKVQNKMNKNGESRDSALLLSFKTFDFFFIFQHDMSQEEALFSYFNFLVGKRWHNWDPSYYTCNRIEVFISQFSL